LIFISITQTKNLEILPRRKKQVVKVNNLLSLEGVLQEVYNEACGNIKSAQEGINNITTAAEPEDVDDHAKVAKAKIDFLKTKTDNVKVKMEVAKLQNDSLKHAGDLKAELNDPADSKVSNEALSSIREMIMEKAKAEDKEADTED